MNKLEFEKEVKKLGLVKVEKTAKPYENDISYYIDETRMDFYGVYKNENNKYVVFYKSLEREVLKNLGEYSTEAKAFEILLSDLKKYSKKG